jgi:GST-like protein
MIDLYYWTTPNGHKLTLFLEEAGLPYRIVPINIGKGEQFAAEFLCIAPDLRERNETIQWLFWQMGGLGPMAGQNHHFTQYAPQPIPYAIERYVKETGRLYAVLNKQLADREFIAGDYSIADMACYPWIVPHEKQGQKLDDFPHLQRWFSAIRERPATQRAYALAKAINPAPVVDENARKVLFGQDAGTVRPG